MSVFKPFQNDSQSVGLGEFTLENQGEQVNSMAARRLRWINKV
mgnify:CR=1 FL=1